MMGHHSMSDEWILGLDLGTSGLRGVITDPAGTLHAEAAAPFVEQSPAHWAAALNAVLQSLRKSLPKVRHIVADATSSTVMLWEEKPVVPVLMYDDNRATAIYQAIKKRLPHHSGAHGATSTLSKVRWLLANQTVGQHTRIAHQIDWLNAQFLGFLPPTDWNNALKLGYDPVELCWPEEIRQLLEPLPPPEVVPSATPLGKISTAMQVRWGFSAHCTVHAGTTDSIAAFLAAGARQPGDAVSSLGTTLALKIVSAHPVFSAPHGIYSHRLGKVWLTGGAANVGGGSLLAQFSMQQIRALGQLRAGPPTGIECYPLRGVGERFPEADPYRRGHWPGQHLPDSVRFQAIVEALVEVERKGYALLHALGAPRVRRLFCSGGGCQNAMWQQLRQAQLPNVVNQASARPPAWGATRLLAGEVT